MNYEFNETDGGLGVLIKNIGDKKDMLLKTFQTCQAGKCSCPTGEYGKIEAMDIKHTDDTIELFLKSKDGEKIDKNQINKCVVFSL